MDKRLFFLNPDHIVSIEETPDTVITLFNDHHFIVKDSAPVIINKIIAFRARILRRSGTGIEKKYLARPRKMLFRSATHKHDQVCPAVSNNNCCTPFHGQDV